MVHMGRDSWNTREILSEVSIVGINQENVDMQQISNITKGHITNYDSNMANFTTDQSLLKSQMQRVPTNNMMGVNTQRGAAPHHNG